MTTAHTDAELIAKVHAAVNATRAVMVGVIGGEIHPFHPMKGHAVDGERSAWFICRRDVSLVREVGVESHAAIVNVVSEDHHLHASLQGELTAERDQARIDQFWSSVADAWLPEGRLSPDVILLRFDPVSAEVWISDNSFTLAWEAAKANFKGQQITSGEKASIRLA
ncbi:pyridoxamine 5'-phosphate oxidase family protein [Caulobacter sp. S45]|uniref:pyridoxamine 5'-phosphate oxidase family protein n=1 Tax=Caulobacter sp. S45 TaxID=1641861 RepID=UPI001575EAC5|nr:pyridoxamine 5'-phosphate oxidase family protein [Caulobacter sp. S45]